MGLCVLKVQFCTADISIHAHMAKWNPSYAKVILYIEICRQTGQRLRRAISVNVSVNVFSKSSISEHLMTAFSLFWWNS